MKPLESPVGHMQKVLDGASAAASGGENVEPFGLQSVWEMLHPIAALPEKAVAAGSSPTSYPVLSSKLRELNAP